MSFAVRQAWPDDVGDLVALAVECQSDPNRACAYLSDDGAAITAELTEIDGAQDWCSVTWVALGDDRSVLGWIAAESDADMGRIWWFGPFLAPDDTGPMAAAVPDALFGIASAAMDVFGEHEVVADERSTVLSEFAERAGFAAGEGSVSLRCDALNAKSAAMAGMPGMAGMAEMGAVAGSVPFGISVVDGAEERVVALHDELFPGTHSPGAHLFGEHDDRHDRFVARIDGTPVGYVATELQHDGSLYVDYLGVDPVHRGHGIGRALVSTALAHRAAEATHAHLTVRTSNERARRLYRSLGFVDEAVLVPYRRGFSLD